MATVTLEKFLTAYLATHPSKKKSTQRNLRLAKERLVAFFGADKLLSTITPGDADEWRLWLRRTKRIRPDEPMPPGLADNTARRTCGRAKQFFKAAGKKKLIDNPFADIGDCQVRANKSRDFFVTMDMANKVLAACPNAQWRLLFAMSRFGGLRTPSEPACLNWSDIDWKAARFTVHSPKTEHHENGESRVVPIFVELRPYLEAAYAEAQDKQGPVFTIKTMRSERPQPSTTMKKIVKAAGLKPWPKLFQNCRASRETELAATHPMHAVCEWIGNSEAVAKEHYLRTTEADFAKATGKKSAGTSAGKKAQEPAQDHTSPHAATLKHVIAKVLEENGLDAKPSVIRDLILTLKAPRAQPSS